MSFLQIVPQELTAAATQLGALGTSLTAQNTAAAAPTTAIVPAAADMVSGLQATIFTAYGTLYQQISAEAAAVHEQFVTTLGLSAGTYDATENLSAAAAVSPFDGISSDVSTIIQSINGTIPDEFNGGIANIANLGVGNYASATSTLIGLAGGGLLPAEEAAEGVAELGGEAALSEVGGAAEAALGGGVAAGLGGASAVGALSVPPTWAGGATLVSSTTPAALSGAGWTTAAAPSAAPGMFMPAGLGSAARNSAGFGAPRYGVKPIVMPKPVSV